MAIFGDMSMMKKDLFIYGTGLTAKHAYELANDSDKYGTITFLNRTLDQYNCVSDYGDCWVFTDKRITEQMKQENDVIVAIMNTMGDIRGVMRNLADAGFSHIIPYAKLADIFPDKFSFLYLEDSVNFMKRMPQIEQARKILEDTCADQRSMQVFESMVNFRKTKNYNFLPEIDKKDNQYFPRDILKYRTDNISFVDCGAYIGDTFEALLKYASDVKANVSCYTGFEPDKDNFKKFEDKLENEKNTKYTLYPYAVCDRAKELYFDMLGTTASKVENNIQTSIHVKGIAMDDIEFSQAPTHIKMDIEGEERNALIGAQNLIRTYKPKLAICIYHKPEDIYDIINLIHAWNLGYRFEMRVYEDVGIDLVLYAI